MSDPTIDYYDHRGEEFAERSLNLDMSAVYEPFLALVPQNGYILDAGCGSGRDSKAFLERGYRVLSIDASHTMAETVDAILCHPDPGAPREVPARHSVGGHRMGVSLP